MERLLNLISDRRRWSLLAAAVLGLGAVWTWVSAVPSSETTGGLIPSPREGFLAPDFELEMLGGDQIRLSDLRGRAVVVNLWASWCPPCRAEMPALQAAYEANRARGLEIIAVDTTWQDRAEDAADFAQEHGLSFPIGLDHSGSISRQYLLRALPSTFFIGPDGVIKKVVIGGPMSEATIRTAVEELFEEGS